MKRVVVERIRDSLKEANRWVPLLEPDDEQLELDWDEVYQRYMDEIEQLLEEP